jgi:hypothetical protein
MKKVILQNELKISEFFDYNKKNSRVVIDQVEMNLSKENLKSGTCKLEEMKL